jgi:hypothetical protein
MSFVIRAEFNYTSECMCQLKAFWYRAGILLKWSNTIRISYVQLVLLHSDYSIGYDGATGSLYVWVLLPSMIDF